MSSKILIADDEAVNRELLEIILEKEGYQLFFAKNGKEALTIIYEEKIELVLLDLLMPEMDGIALLKLLEKEKKANPKIMIITALAKEKSTLLIQKYQADGYVTKPFDIVQLKQDIYTLLGTSKKQLPHVTMQSNIDWHKVSMAYLEKNIQNTTAALRLLLQTIEELKEEDNILNRKLLIPSQQQLKSLIIDSFKNN